MVVGGQAAQPALLSKVYQRCQLTPMGNGERLVGWFGDAIRYCHDTKSWFIWDTRRWAHDRVGRIDRLAKATVRFIYGEAAMEHDDDRCKRLTSWARQSQSRRQIQEMVAFATSEVPVQIEELDRQSFLSTPSTALSISHRRHPRPRPQDFLTKISPVAFDPQETCRGGTPSSALRWPATRR